MSRIVTHDGRFHADEALACAMLMLLPQYKGAQIVRSRDPKEWTGTVVDVGGVYDASNNKFDHHQRGFNETFSPSHFTKLSSAGLVYKHFGKQVINEITGKNNGDDLHVLVYDEFIEAFDAIDNGIDQYTQVPKFKDNTSVCKLVGVLPEDGFPKAMEILSLFLRQMILNSEESLESRKKVLEALEKDAQVLVFDEYVSWKKHVCSIPSALYVVYPADAAWRVQAVSIENSFQSRKPFPESWRGLRDNELSSITKVEGCVFCHSSGFLLGTKTKEQAERIAHLSKNM